MALWDPAPLFTPTQVVRNLKRSAFAAKTAPTTWALVVGEYPPQTGGVADYTWQVAQALSALGDTVHVYAPPTPVRDVPGVVQVHRLSGQFGPRSVIELLLQLRRLQKPRRMILHYMPQSFGMRSLNFPFALSLFALRSFPLWVMFHEFAQVDDPRQSLLVRAQALGTRWMAALVARSANKTFVSTLAWSELVSKSAPRHKSVTWVPIPSNIPADNASATSSPYIRAQLGIPTSAVVVGHFGTFLYEETCQSLEAVIPALLDADASRRFLLIGRNGQMFAKSLLARHPSLVSRLIVTGGLTPEALAAHLAVCDVLVQPFGDGVTTRRTSLIAGLALGIPTVSTVGTRTEGLWKTSEAVLLAPAGDTSAIVDSVESLLRDTAARTRLSKTSRDLYDRIFDLRHTIDALRVEHDTTAEVSTPFLDAHG